MGPKDRPKDLKRRAEFGDIMARFAWAAKARGITSVEISRRVGDYEMRFANDCNVVTRHAVVRPQMIAAYQAILGLTLEYLLAPNGDDVPVDRRLVPKVVLGQSKFDVGRVLAENGVSDDESVRDVIEIGLLLHQFRLHPGEVLEFLAMKQQRDREEAAKRIRRSLEQLGGGE